MAKIYEWQYKGQTGQITADNTKEAKKVIAKKFGNAIKIPKGTVIKKIGLAKKKTLDKTNKEDLPKTPKKVIVDTLPEGTVVDGPDGQKYTIGQRGKKPVWVGGVILKMQGVSGVKVEEVEESDNYDPSTNMFRGYELKCAYIMEKQTRIIGPVSFIWEINGKKSLTGVGDDVEVVVPSGTKVWKVGGDWNIV
jgi:hypothetical protein